MRLLKRMILLALAVMLLSGCTKSSISDVAPSAAQNNEKEEGPVGYDDEEDDENLVPRNEDKLIEENPEPQSLYDWDQVDTETSELFFDQSIYPQAVSMSYKADEDAKTAELVWTLKTGTTQEEGEEYATELLQKFNDIIATQTIDMEFASDTSFGGLWETFSVSVQIRTEDGTVLVDKSYGAGEKIDLPLPVYNDVGPESVEDDSPKKS